MHKTFIIGSIFNVPLQTKTAFLGTLSSKKTALFLYSFFHKQQQETVTVVTDTDNLDSATARIDSLSLYQTHTQSAGMTLKKASGKIYIKNCRYHLL